MTENPFDLIWLSAFVLGCMLLPVVFGLLALLIERR
jgi:hypothetical protein